MQDLHSARAEARLQMGHRQHVRHGSPLLGVMAWVVGGIFARSVLAHGHQGALTGNKTFQDAQYRLRRC